MEYIRITNGDLDGLKGLHTGYKQEIGEEAPTDENFDSLSEAIQKGQILFYGCIDAGRLIACCSITPTYSTFHYQTGGVFEDFYIVPEYRHRGIARQLVRFAYQESGVGSLTVGCADCDMKMYQSLGFTIPLGNLLAFEGQLPICRGDTQVSEPL